MNHLNSGSFTTIVSTMLLALAGVAVAAPTEVLPLSGMGEPGEAAVYWDFRLDAGRGAGKWNRIRVPSCWEQEGFGAYYYGAQGRGKPDSDPIIPKERGDYRTEFAAPTQWRGRQVRIVFEGAMTDTTVRINGQVAGPTHQGGFYRFHYDITPLLKYGARNLLEVSVSKESSNPSVNHAERRGDYWTFGGLYRPVWLEARPTHHIEWTAIDARADGSFYAQVHLGSEAPTGSVVRARIYDPEGNAVGRALSAPVGIHDTTAVITGKLDNPRTWSAETPHLYRVELTLIAASNEHRVSERFGFRTFEVRPRDGLYLNGRKIVLKGINRHSFAPATGRTITREQSYNDARLIKDANMNAVRMSHYPPDKHFLEAADELGLYVLDELAGWQGSYDTPTGARLIGQIVRRDVNHPSILFWDNGNEGGWNRDNDGEFDRWDPQRRPVLHPWALHSGVNTDHYEDYASTVKLSGGPDIFMPTEFLHGLYDGGIGAGLRDYWDAMGNSPTVGGGFFWVFADEGIERTDRDRRIDTMGNSAPDGMLGPNREKEGSFYAVKQIWSPVQVSELQVDRTRPSLRMMLNNRYAFTNLSQCKFTWRALKLPRPGEASSDQRLIAEGEVAGPAINPGEQGAWEIPLAPGQTGDEDVFHLTAKDPEGRELWTWSVANPGQESRERSSATDQTTLTKVGNDRGIVQSGPYELSFDTRTGRLAEIRKHGKLLPLSDGPRLVAYTRTERAFQKIAATAKLRRLDLQANPRSPDVLATAAYDGPLREVTWRRSGDSLAMSYEIAYQGEAHILGVRFELPESQVVGKRWVGNGPYRVWQNRLEGGVFGFHETSYNDPIPGETFAYPEFKGYFGNWRWVALDTATQSVTVENVGAVPYFGLYGPRGGVSPVLELPDVGWSFLHVIPAMGTKFDLPESLGPQSQPQTLSGIQRGELRFDFEARGDGDRVSNPLAR
ncbi:MAG TPA: glycoside hydrolase family 2 TIM barrel-domain containing protein [Steroidobacter sp.]|uniref:glycoside hydrolase family 2 protein n=1 Tax=Steroidobacter sp. TaxID=1978227 RepID=UPI002ED7A988